MSAILKKYNRATTIYFPLVAYSTTSFLDTSTAVSFASGDVKIFNGTGMTNAATLPSWVGSGMYALSLTAAEMSTAYPSVFLVDSATKAFEDQAILIETYGTTTAAHAFDLNTATQPVNVTQWNGSAVATPDTAGYPVVTIKDGTGQGEIALTGGAVDNVTTVGTVNNFGASATGQVITANVAQISGDATAADNAEAFFDGTGYAGTGNTIPTVTTVTNGVTVSTNNDKTGYRLSATGVDDIWDEARSGHTTDGTFGQVMQVVRSGTAQTGTSSDITLDASASATDNLYRNTVISIVSGTGAGQTRYIHGYVGSSKAASVTPNWITTPDNTSVFVIRPTGPAAWDHDLNDHENANSFGMASQVLAAGTSSTFSGSSITLDSNAGSTDDQYNGCVLVVTTNGTTPTQAHLITDYVGATKVATITPAFVGTTVGSVNYVVKAHGMSDVRSWVSSVVNSLISGRVDSNTQAMANGVITAAAIATDAIDADALAADAVTEIWNKAMTELSSVPGVTGSVLEALEWVFLLARNKVTQTSSTQTLRNNADNANIATSSHSDDGTTHTRAKWS